MSGLPPSNVVTFNVIHNDGLVSVRIEDGFATVEATNINDDEVIVRTINRAAASGAVRGTLFTNEVVNDQIAAMHAMRAAKGITWLGGKVTRLTDGAEGPQFRIDWDEFPTVTV